MTERLASRGEIKVVCPLCVQWRCVVCKSDDWPSCDNGEHYDAGCEPYWPDGTVAVLTQDVYCDRCAESVADYEANSGGF